MILSELEQKIRNLTHKTDDDHKMGNIAQFRQKWRGILWKL